VRRYWNKKYIAINFEVPAEDSAIFIVRKKKYFGSASLVKILVDGREVAKLGVGEMERIAISPGSHKINVKIASILQAGIGGDATAIGAPYSSLKYTCNFDINFMTSWRDRNSFHFTYAKFSNFSTIN
jgi:hypothetical protein